MVMDLDFVFIKKENILNIYYGYIIYYIKMDIVKKIYPKFKVEK
jgi:hypothetical protein